MCATPRAASFPLGPWAEGIAARFLVDHGYRIVGRNFRTTTGEIDVIAQDGDCLVFVEVKARRGIGYGRPVEAVDHRKRVRLRSAALAFLAGSGRGPGGWALRFDVVSVVLPHDEADPIIEHFVAAF